MQPASPRQTTSRAADLRPALLHPSAERLFLTTARRMAIFGLDDAQSVSTLLSHFGRSYRRPLVLMRALMLEMSLSSDRKISLAPPCCGKMTADEALMLKALSRHELDTPSCHADACALLGKNEALGTVTCLQAVSQAFADLGYPFG